MVYRKIERYNYHAILGSLCHSLPPGIQPRYAVADAIAGKDPAAFGGFGPLEALNLVKIVTPG